MWRHGKEKGRTLQEQVDVVDVQGDGSPVLIVISGVQVRQHASSLAASCQHGPSARHGWDKQTSLSCRATTWPELKGPQRTAARKVKPPRSNSRRGKHGQTPVWALEGSVWIIVVDVAGHCNCLPCLSVSGRSCKHLSHHIIVNCQSTIPYKLSCNFFITMQFCITFSAAILQFWSHILWVYHLSNNPKTNWKLMFRRKNEIFRNF